MKHTFSVFISSAVIVATAVVLSVAGGLKGDVNKDGKITLVDAKWILQNVAGVREFDSQQLEAADVNSDGRISVLDAKWTLQILAGLRETPTDATQQESTIDDATVTEPQKPDVTVPDENYLQALKEKIVQAQAIDSTYYTDETAQALTQAIQAGEAVACSENPTKEQVQQAINDINSAIASLKSLKQILEQTVEMAEAYDITACESDMVKRFNSSLSFAQRILSSETATPTQYKAAQSRISGSLSEIDAYKQELSQLRISFAKELEEYRAVDTSVKREGSAIMPGRINDFYEAIEAAQAIYDNPACTKSDIENQLNALENSKNLLHTYKEVLKHNIIKARELYNEEKLNGSPDFKTVINDVSLIYNDSSSTDADYSAAMETLSNATKEFHAYYLGHTQTGIIDWT